jgi:hypothetical protein
MLGAHIDRVELDAVRHHQGDRVAVTNTETVQGSSHQAGLVSVLTPGQLLRSAHSADGDGLRIDAGSRLERGAQCGRLAHPHTMVDAP